MKNKTFGELLTLGKNGNDNAIHEMNHRIELAKNNHSEVTMDIINSFDKAIKMYVKKYLRIVRTYEYDDLYSWGVMGVLNAIQKYDPNYNCLFSTICFTEIKSNISNKTRNEWSKNNYCIMNLENNDYANDEGVLTVAMLIDENTDVFQTVYNNESAKQVIKAFEHLTETQQKVMVSIYINQLTLQETADLLGLSYKATSRHRERAVDTLRLKLKNVFREEFVK